MKELSRLIQAQFNKMCATGKLFRSSVPGTDVWNLYLNSFAKEDDPVFRDPKSTVHNCNLCKNFIRRYGNIVALDENYNIMTIFDVDPSEEYVRSCNNVSKLLNTSPIGEVFFETFAELNSLPYETCKKTNEMFKLGILKNVKRYTKEEAEMYGVVKPNQIVDFNHLAMSVPKSFVDMSGASVENLMAKYRDSKNVFKRAMEEISLDTLKLVRDLIIQNSLLDGQSHLDKIEKFIIYKSTYNTISVNSRDAWCWVASYDNRYSRFRNELIGTLCVELSQGEELNKACQTWNKRVDPANYMKAIAPITKRQIEEARKFVEENGYEDSFDRRFANIDDIKVSEIKHINNGDGKIQSVSIFDSVKSGTSQHKRNEFDGIEEVSIDKFMKDILPNCTSVEAYLLNGHSGNLVSLTTANVKESKPIFKWTNNYSWTFNGNLAGKSQIKEAVKDQGGKVDGVLRFSIMWAENDIDDSDLDAHCIEPYGNEIYFAKPKSYNSKGNLDIDIQRPQQHKKATNKPVVENITYPSLEKMNDGEYRFFVHQYNARNSQGFTAEIEFNGETYSYVYDKRVIDNVDVARVILKNGVFSINHSIPTSQSVLTTREIYGLNTNEFHKVSLVCLSPNHWNDNNVGNKHYMFMLDGCKCPTSIRSFHNENLISDLLPHRKVMEVLGISNMIEPTDKQLSGLGFNATVKDELIVRLQGNFKRVIKIKF